jgi:NADPH:quinone reductase-like Zn-dependent oxidoreductase
MGHAAHMKGATFAPSTSTMRAVEFNRFGAAREVLQIVADAPAPEPASGEVQIRVCAGSVNPSDCAIRSGYGKEIFRHKGQVGSDPFPQRLGRDAAGVVTALGEGVRNYQVGDRVFTAPTRATLADYICVDESELAPMPSRLDFIAAASLPFVALTTWTAMVSQVGLTRETTPTKRVVITRGAGGVGSFAVQFMKAWGAHVATTCSTRNVELCRRLGADVVVDYTQQKVGSVLRDYDVVLDGAFDMQEEMLATLKTGADASYITIVSPKIRLVDQLGLEEGLRQAGILFEQTRQQQAALGRRYHWGFMQPDGAALAQIGALVDADAISPLVDRVYPLERIAEAHEYCELRQARGKIVIDLLTGPG